MFNEKETDVLLIEKKKPKWQLGKFNGIGGKCEEGERFSETMIREFAEETGIIHDKFRPVILIGGDDWEVQVFACKSDKVFDFKTMEEETVNLLPLNELDSYDLISSLYWLIPMSLDALHGQINYDIQNLAASPSYSGVDADTKLCELINEFDNQDPNRNYTAQEVVNYAVELLGKALNAPIAVEGNNKAIADLNHVIVNACMNAMAITKSVTIDDDLNKILQQVRLFTSQFKYTGSNKEVEDMAALLKEYEQWEVDLISDNAMWWPTVPKDRISGKTYDKMIELQAKRNKLLSTHI